METPSSTPPIAPRPPRAVLALDPFVSNVKPPVHYSYSNLPSPSSPEFSDSRSSLKNAFPTLSSSSSPPSYPRPSLKRLSATDISSSSGLHYHPSQFGKINGRPHQSSAARTLFGSDQNVGLPSLDVEMTDAYSTPPMTRILPTATNLGDPTPTLSGPRSSVTTRVVGPSTLLAPINVACSNATSPNLLFPAVPLTPPLTPPCITSDLPLPPVVQLPKPAPPPPTLASRALINYPLHPLFTVQYTIHEELGCGGFGFVVRAIRHEDQSSVAVKFIEKAKIPSHGWVISRSFSPASGVVAKEDGQRLLPMEAYILGYVRNIPGVVRYIDLFEDSRYFYLVMEHHGSPWQSSEKEPATAPIPIGQPTFAPQQTATPASSPTFYSASSSMELSPPRPVPMVRRSSCDLFECIEQHSRFSEETARDVFAQVVEVVYQLGKLGICHRDIKDENIVVSADFKVKLIDFGSAVLFHPDKPLPTYSRFYGTTSFASAEILRGDPYHAPPSEVWSLGVLLSILVTGEVPFADQEAAKIGRISCPRFPVSAEVQDLMRRCLIVDPSRRINIAQIRRHPWLTQGAQSA